jgi:hypothetical protein
MHSQPFVRPLVARLVGADGGAPAAARRRQLYRPLMIGGAVLRRPRTSEGRWRVRLADDAFVRPWANRRGVGLHSRLGRLRAAGVTARVAAALVAPEDVLLASGQRPALGSRFPERLPPRRGRVAEFYGWALLYQLPGMRGIGFVDPHECFPDLPAFFESPLELLDRATFLRGKGVVTRPLAVLTRPEDFEVGADGTMNNRFFPEASFAKPVKLDWLDEKPAG